MTLDDLGRLCIITCVIALYAYFGAHHVNFNKKRHTCSSGTLNFWQYKVYVDIRSVYWREGVKRVG